MKLTVLAVGDVVSDAGVEYLSRRLPGLKKQHGVDFTVVNGENAAGVGILPRQAAAMFVAGADVITLGNHAFGKTQILPLLEEEPRLLRPENLGGQKPGRGCAVFDCGALRIGVLNLIGRCGMDFNADNPFRCADRALETLEADLFLVDFHGEATSEKLAMAHFLDGRVAALWGTHTHVPTADAGIFPKGTGYLTDLGMTGPANGVLGIRAQQSVELFLGGLPGRFEAESGPCKLEACLFELDSETRRCTEVQQLLIRD